MSPAEMAAIHAACFDRAPPPWSAQGFASLLAGPGILLAAEPGGFAIGRLAGPEAELLTLAVIPAARRQGLGQRLLGRVESMAARRGAEEIFLEVGTANGPARALYAASGYAQAGMRQGYHGGADALILARRLPG